MPFSTFYNAINVLWFDLFGDKFISIMVNEVQHKQ
jgi:hypothetical protein